MCGEWLKGTLHLPSSLVQIQVLHIPTYDKYSSTSSAKPTMSQVQLLDNDPASI